MDTRIALDLIACALHKYVRVNESLGSVELFDEYGVKLVLRDLDEPTLNAFKLLFKKY